MPTTHSINVNHHVENAVNAPLLEECNLQNIIQIYTLSDSELQTRTPVGQIRYIQLNVSYKKNITPTDWIWNGVGILNADHILGSWYTLDMDN